MAFSVAKKYNTEKIFDIDTEGFEYKSLEDLFISEETVYPVCAIYINTKGNFGKEPILATDECYVNLPHHMVDACMEMIKDEEAVAAINDGLVGFTIYQYHQKKYNKDCYGIRWVDVDREA